MLAEYCVASTAVASYRWAYSVQMALTASSTQMGNGWTVNGVIVDDGETAVLTRHH